MDLIQQSNYGYQLNEEGQLDTGFGAMRDIFMYDELAFTTVDGGGLVIFNVSDLAKPVIIGQYDEEYEITEEQWWSESPSSSVYVNENIAYLVGGTDELVILNVTHQHQPIKIGQYQRDVGGIPKIFVKEKYVFFGGVDKIHIINVTNPQQPYLTSIIDYNHLTTTRINYLNVLLK